MVISQGTPLSNLRKPISFGPVGMSITEAFSNTGKFSSDDFFKQFSNSPYIFLSNPLFVRTPKLLKIYTRFKTYLLSSLILHVLVD